MKVTDASEIVNSLYKQMTGQSDIATVDNSNIVDIGRAIQSSGNDTDVIYRGLVDRIGKMVIANKSYVAKLPKIYRDGWEFGSILQTVRVKTIDAVADPSYNPVNGQDYPLTTFNKMDVTQKFYSDADNFQLKYWRPMDQLWTAFNSMEELTRFFSGIEIAVSTSMEKRLQALAKNTINNMIAQTLHKEHPDGNYSTSTDRAVNLLSLYKAAVPGTILTAETCNRDPDFLRFVGEVFSNYADRMTDLSTIYNIDEEEEFTDKDDLAFTMLSTWANSLKFNLYSDTFHYDLMQLPGFDTTPYWQSCGEHYDRGVIEEVNVTIKTGDSETATVEASGIVAIMYDRESVAINCEKNKLTSFYHPDLDQTLFFDKYTAQYINRFDKNFVVFYVAD